ncbi:glucose 1-dehydrogenase [Planococcus shenhongbingii]|uniref:Glucose 1-dehydrogenase n=1 Tax=Planococcus shenhongbingii TaxID=3058398 RepID=A0ABT8NG50_9BACL|nr:glucose 1-dehydrogenase [Planococcus sp. N017]MDN7246857.1 glucose 1-dehydrogenase [Planococcus sp. N017]
MYPDLTGKTAIVTGASKGIGKGIAERFGKEKMNVVVDYHTDKRGAEETVAAITANGGNAVFVEADVANEEGVQKLINAALDQYGSIDVLVNNAGFSKSESSEELSLENWQRVLDVNLTGAFIASREAIKQMLAKGRPGCILNITSVHQVIPKVDNAHYAVTKVGLKMLTETLALEYAEQGIRINAIAPGTINTPANPAEDADPEEKQKTLEKIPMKKIGQPEQIAAAAAWIVSSEADYVTGTTLFVDGGMTLYPSQLK